MIYNYFLKFIPYDLRLKNEYHKQLCKIHKSQLINRKNSQTFNKLLNFIKYNKENSKFYSNLYSKIDLNKFKSFNDFKSLPVITKNDIKHRNLVPKKIKIKKMFYTSGTTGNPIGVPISKDFEQKEIAIYHYFFRYSGFNSSDFRLELRYNKIKNDYIIDYAHRCIKINMNFDSINIDDIILLMRKMNISYISGYPSLLSKFALKFKNYKEFFLRINGIFLMSEQFLPFQGEIIKEFFSNSLIISFYGMTEAVAFGVSFDLGKSYNFISEYGFTELSNDGYSIISTGFFNNAFPLIRYKLEDEAINPVCCAKTGEIIKCGISGRKEDFLINEKGNEVSGSILTFPIKKKLCINYVKIIQNHDSSIIFYYNSEKKLSQNIENELHKEYSKIFGSGIYLKIKYMPIEFFKQTGKYKWIENRSDF